MKKRRNKGVEITVLLGFMALAVLLFYLNERSVNPTLPKSAVINWPLKTYYVGNMAVDMPESWKHPETKAKFYLANEKDSPEISFTDKPWPGDQRVDEKLKTELAAAEKEQGLFGKKKESIWRQDVSEIVGRPAAIVLSESKSARSMFKSRYTDNSNIDHLDISLVLVEPQAILKFVYAEDLVWPDGEEKTVVMAAKQKKLIDWVLVFLPRYQWTGHNAAPSVGFLATGYGRITIEKDWPESWHVYEMEARFGGPPALSADFKLFSDLSISFYSHQQLKNESAIPNRTVGGHAGEETKKLKNHNTGFRKFLFWKPSLLWLNLDWKDLSSGPFTEANPDISIRGSAMSYQKGKQGIADVLGAWDILLNSVRPATVNDLKE